MLNSLILGFLIIFTVAACQHQVSQLDGYNKVKKGMTKPEVVNLAGPPKLKSRKNNVDRWVYVFEVETADQTSKEIQFRKGKVSYKGDPTAPPDLDADDRKKDAQVESAKSEAFLKTEIERNNRINNEVRSRGHSNDLSEDVIKMNAEHYKKLNEDLEIGEIIAPEVKPDATEATKSAAPVNPTGAAGTTPPATNPTPPTTPPVTSPTSPGTNQ